MSAIIAALLTSCSKDQSNLIPELEGTPAGGLLGISVESVDSNEIIFNASVFAVDHLGGFLQNLTAENFEIDNANSGYDISILDVRYLEQQRRGAFSATMLFDQSGSISSTDPQNARITAGLRFADFVNNGDEASIVAFTSGGNYASPYEILTDFSDDPEVLKPPIEGMRGNENGGTPLNTSLFELIEYTNENAANENQAVIAFTDGQDTDGGYSVDDIIGEACENEVRLYTVGLGSGVQYPELYELAFRTGGAVLVAETAPQLISLYGSLGALLHGESKYYSLRLRATKKQGVWDRFDFINNVLTLLLNNSNAARLPIILDLLNDDLLPFYQRVPNCPCFYDDIIEDELRLCQEGAWIKCGAPADIVEKFHPGAALEARWIPTALSAPGQQCTYDQQGNLITDGITAGTPDRNAPGGCGGILSADIFHWHLDVVPFSNLPCTAYLAGWPPNDGIACSPMAQYPISHMAAALGSLNYPDVITFIDIVNASPQADATVRAYINGIALATPTDLKQKLMDISSGDYCQTQDCTVVDVVIQNLN